MRLLSLLVVIAIASATLTATVVVPAEFREIVRDATLIVRGRVTDVRAVVVADRGIDTIGTVTIDAVLKGAADSSVAVRVPGGTVGGTRRVLVGAPTLTLNELAIFFLKRGADNAWRPVGLAMGIHRVQFDRATRRVFVNAPVALDATASVGPVVRGDARRKPMAVAEFESLVRLVLTAQSGAGR